MNRVFAKRSVLILWYWCFLSSYQRCLAMSLTEKQGAGRFFGCTFIFNPQLKVADRRLFIWVLALEIRDSCARDVLYIFFSESHFFADSNFLISRKIFFHIVKRVVSFPQVKFFGHSFSPISGPTTGKFVLDPLVFGWTVKNHVPYNYGGWHPWLSLLDWTKSFSQSSSMVKKTAAMPWSSSDFIMMLVKHFQYHALTSA